MYLCEFFLMFMLFKSLLIYTLTPYGIGMWEVIKRTEWYQEHYHLCQRYSKIFFMHSGFGN